MTRPMCRLCGMEFPLPIQMDEVPKQRHGDDEPYFVCQTPSLSNPGRKALENFVDRNRDMTREHVETNRAHWTSDGAIQQHLALANAMQVFKKKNRVLDVTAAIQHAMEHAE